MKSQFLQLFKGVDATPKFKISCDTDDTKFTNSGAYLFDKSISLKKGAVYVDVISKFDTTDAYDVKFASDVALSISNNNQAIVEEATRAQLAEGVIRNDLITERTERKAYDTSSSASLASETASRLSADNTLNTNIIYESSLARANEAVNTVAISDEKLRANAAELVLRNDGLQEVADRKTAITSEAKSRNDADVLVNLRVDDEKKAREDDAVTMRADYRLLNTTENARAMASELVLTNRLAFLTSNISPVAMDSLGEIVASLNLYNADLFSRVLVLEGLISTLRNEAIYPGQQMVYTPAIPPA